MTQHGERDDLAIGIDIGGTKVIAGVVTTNGELVTERRYPSPDNDVPTTVITVAKAVTQLRTEYPISAIGIGVAGWLDNAGDLVRHSPNLGWQNVPFRAMVMEAVDQPVTVDNDANAAAWAEYKFGAGKAQLDSESSQSDNLLAVTVGTGIGGGIIFEGRLYRGSFGMAGEFGHTQVVQDGELCTCGARGCWERYASGSALERFAQQGLIANPDKAPFLAQFSGQLTGPQITQAALAGDEVARQAFTQVGYWLGVGLADLVAEWDPAVIVVGGGVAETGALLMDNTLRTYHASLAAHKHPKPYAEIVTAHLGNNAGLIGAADLARRTKRI